MNWQSIRFDWNQARAFLATAEEGSLSAAAKALGLTQPTLSRQVAALEEDLSVTLFERVGRALSLTQSGMDLLEHFRSMGEAASQISLAASGRSQTVEGRVTITATDLMAAYHLPPVIKTLRQTAPGIEIDVNTSNDLRDLLRREADIAIRHVRPEQPDLIAKLIAEASAYFYASPDYLDSVGRPQTLGDLSELDFVGVGQGNERLREELGELGVALSPRNFKVTTETGIVLVELVKQGLGVSVLPEDICRQTDSLEKILPDNPPIKFPVWLATHRELHTSRRIRIVFDLLAEELSSRISER